MKILMVAPQPFFEARGTPISVLGRLRALSTLGHQIDLVTYHLGVVIRRFYWIMGKGVPKIPREFHSFHLTSIGTGMIFLIACLLWKRRGLRSLKKPN